MTCWQYLLKIQNMNNNLDGWLSPLNASLKYLELSEQYLLDDEQFKNFKSNPEYFNTFDVSYSDSQIYKTMIDDDYQITSDQYIRFMENDLVGNPKVYSYGDYTFSPPTVRYIKDSFFIKKNIQDVKIKKILEVGAGYGGLCKTLDVIIDFEEYVFVDLDPIIKLQEKYLKCFECLNDKNFKFISTSENNSIENIDLFISNYSLSECNFDIQMKYFDLYISNSKYVNIIYNYYTGDFDKFVDKLKTDFDVNVTNDFNNKLIFAKRK